MDKQLTNIFEEFRKTVKRTPRKNAILYKDYKNYTPLNYQALYNQVNDYALLLRDNGIKKGDRVAIILDNTPLWPAVFLALMSLGATVVPLDPHLENGETGVFLTHADVTCIVTQLAFYPKIQEITANIQINTLVLDSEETIQKIRGLPLDQYPQEEISSDELALIVYTSGTTANPKGVMLSHANLLSNIRSLKKLGIVNSQDCLLAALPFHHTYPFTVNLLLPLLLGATISFPLYIGVQEIIECIKETGVTIFVGVPRLFILIQQKIQESIDEFFFLKRGALKSVLALANLSRKYIRLNLPKAVMAGLHSQLGGQFRLMVSGGARLDPRIAQTFHRWGFMILEGYGLTETSPVVTFNRMDKFRFGSVGMPISGVDVRIHQPDESGKGEIIVKGENVTSGYYKAEKLTQAAIKDGWFFTGDEGVIDADGFLFIQDRIKELVVLNTGKKFNPEEVEAYYNQSPHIAEICVFAVTEPQTHKDIVSAVILPHYENLRAHGITQIKDRIRLEVGNLSHKLPSYKRIKKYTIINDILPRTPLGKIKRYLVREKYVIRWEEPKTPAALSYQDKQLLANPLCQKAYQYLCDKLKKPISPDANLEVDLGLDSLEQISLFLEFQEAVGFKFENQDIFNIFTVRDVLNMLARGAPADESTKEFRKISPWKEILDAPATEQVQKTIVLRPKKRHIVVSWLFQSFLRIISYFCFRLEVVNKENLPEGPVILCPTHASYLDGPMIFTSLPLRVLFDTYFLGFRAYFDHPLLAWAKKSLRLIPIESRLDVTESLQACSYILKNDKILCIFGEGGCSRDGTIQELKLGLGILIKELDADVVPAYIQGSFAAWPRWRLLPRPGKITIILGRKITAQELITKEGDDIDIYKNIVHNLREKLIALKQEND